MPPKASSTPLYQQSSFLSTFKMSTNVPGPHNTPTRKLGPQLRWHLQSPRQPNPHPQYKAPFATPTFPPQPPTLPPQPPALPPQSPGAPPDDNGKDDHDNGDGGGGNVTVGQIDSMGNGDDGQNTHVCQDVFNIYLSRPNICAAFQESLQFLIRWHRSEPLLEQTQASFRAGKKHGTGYLLEREAASKVLQESQEGPEP